MSAVTPGLPLPNLDDRRWTDLIAEGRTLIPLYAPEWTNHNVSDPGITLMELLAWLAEQGIFRIDRIGSEQVRKFLALAGQTPAPPLAARTVLGFAPEGYWPETVKIDAGIPFTAVASDGSVVSFRTLAHTTALVVTLKAFQVWAAGSYLDRTRRWQRSEPIALWGDNPSPGSAFLLGFDKSLLTDERFSLYFTVRDPADSAHDRERLLKEAGSPTPRHLVHHTVQLIWEASAGPGRWEPLHFEDETRSLTLNGRMLLTGSPLAAAVQLGRVEDQLYYLRCRIVSGPHDAAPQLLGLAVNGVEAEQTVPNPPTPLPLGIRRPPHEAGSHPHLERLRDGEPWPHQKRTLAQRPVVAASVKVFTLEEGKWRQWHAQPDFDASGRADAHFVLDAQTGTLTFGDGEHGRTLPNKAQLYAAYRATRAAAGNGLFSGWGATAAMPTSLAITQPRPAWGGSDAETLDQVEARLLDGLAQQFRAITLADCVALAQNVPGTVVATAQATADQHPDLTGVPAPGVISVTILPELPAANPAPTPGLCRVVAAYLNRRGVLGTRIEVAGPIYYQVTATVTLQATSGARAQDVRSRVVMALDRFFHPLTGGPAGKGWPAGREVYRAEVLQALAQMPGVESVVSLDLSLDGGSPQCGNLCLGPRGLPTSGPHKISVVSESAQGRKAQAVP
jgi:predicted phage baseplate assembly protein